MRRAITKKDALSQKVPPKPRPSRTLRGGATHPPSKNNESSLLTRLPSEKISTATRLNVEKDDTLGTNPFDGDGSEAESIKNQISHNPRMIAQDGTDIDWRHHGHDFQNKAEYPLYPYANNRYFSPTHRNGPMPIYPKRGFPFQQYMHYGMYPPFPNPNAPPESAVTDGGFVYFEDHYNTAKLGQRSDDKSKKTATSSSLPSKAVAAIESHSKTATVESPSKTVVAVQSPLKAVTFNELPSEATTATGSPSRTF
ncbi:hypothetical protein BGZ46_003153 [Entomortierella lignicola]|nr:hypothetical protein BGZ46_003153 [Entomortierella lignicola]